MLAYIAGRLTNEEERKRLEEIDILCKNLGFETFLPHRDAGIVEGMQDVKRIFEEDITKSLAKSEIVIALLDGLHVGAGTAWELGYAYSKGIPVLGIKTDESLEEALPYLSAILVASMPIAKSIEEAERMLREFRENKKVQSV